MVKPRPHKGRGFTAVQMEFGEVVELEPVAGDPEYTAWLAAGRPAVELDEETRRGFGPDADPSSK